MYTVMIVEDEMLVRIGLVACVPWKQLGLEVVAEASDGLTAKQAFEKHHPDIVITDLRIPYMNGIELMQEIRKQDSTCAFVVVTCVDDDESYQEVESLDIQAYLIKASMERGDVIEAMRKSCRFLESVGRNPKDEQEGAKLSYIIERYLLDNGVSNKELNALLYNNRYSKEVSALLVVRLFRDGEIGGLLFNSITNIIKDYLSETEPCCCKKNDREMVVLLQKGTSIERLRNAVSQIKNYVMKTFTVDVCVIAVLESIHINAIRDVIEKLEKKYNDPCLFDNAVVEVNKEGEIADQYLLECTSELKRYIWLLQNKNSCGRITALISTIEESFEKGMYETKRSIAAFIVHIKENTNCLPDAAVFQFEKQTEDVKGVHSLLESFNNTIIASISDYIEKNERAEIIAAISYMINHFAENLSVQDVAQEIGMNPTYFSKLFKQETGINFTSYLSNIRIEQAIEMLKKRSMNIQEVAEKCGFSDVSYFCNKFKQYTHTSPSRWRNEE